MAWYNVENLMQAAGKGEYDKVRAFILKDKNRANVQDHSRRLALHHAASKGHASIVDFLIHHTKDIDSLDEYKNTPLLVASKNGHVKVMKSLLSWGANPNHKDIYSKTPLAVCASNGDSEGIETLLYYGANASDAKAMWNAISSHVEIAELLVRKGANPNIFDGDYVTPMMMLAENGYLHVLKTFKEHGGDINACDSDHDSVLHYAALNNHLNIVEYLLSQNVRLDIENKKGQTAYAIAVKKKYTQVAKIIKAAMDAENPETTATPLLLPAPSMSHSETAENWVRMGDHMIARIGTYPEAGQKLTEIFNFESAERLIVIQDIHSHGQCTTPPQSFNEIPQEIVNKAKAAFVEQNGDPEKYSQPLLKSRKL